jgi:hypothetical protein
LAAGDGRQVEVSTVLQVMLNSFAAVHTVWRERKTLTAAQISEYARHIENFRNAWLAFRWKSTPWVHWVLSHSVALVREWKNIAVFSSIPTEMRHRPFKRDLRHCFLGGKSKAPRRAALGLAALVANDAIDKQLQLRHAADPGGRKKRRRVS